MTVSELSGALSATGSPVALKLGIIVAHFVDEVTLELRCFTILLQKVIVITVAWRIKL